MAVSFNPKFTGQRAVFTPGKQKEFLCQVREKTSLSWLDFAKKFQVHQRTLADWKNEKYSLPLDTLKKICHETRMAIPDWIEIKGRFWYVNNAAKIGGIAMYKKYGRVGGDPGYRKKCWREWWKKEGRYRKDLITAVTKPIKKPALSLELAEFIGILLGDGGITRTQVTITLNRHDDKEYINYVKNLLVKLFEVIPSIYEWQGESVTGIVVSRTELVNFLVKNGLKIGGKVRQQVGIPHWIKESDSYSRACLRGLFDTDGCFYIDRHKYKDKIYLNAGMNFTNRSLPILKFFKGCLERSGFHPTQNTKFHISLRREKEIIRYFHKIRSSNAKHIDKFERQFGKIRGGVG